MKKQNPILVPTIPSGNIHAPVVMVAEKGADLIKELWLQEQDNTIRYERAAEESASSKKVDGAASKKVSHKKVQATTSKKVNVFTNATAA